MSRLFLATGNEGKIKEMKELLSELDIELITSDDLGGVPEVIEDGETLTENALKKAKTLADYTELTTIADDTGLLVDVLDGKPGVHSARYAGEEATDQENNQKLLKDLAGVLEKERTARFKTVMALVKPAGEDKIVKGTCEGHIATGPAGENGFGYDPLFIPVGYDKTLAQLEPEIKNQISHRGEALEKMKYYLEAKF